MSAAVSREQWEELRSFVAGEVRDYVKANDTARSKDARVIFSALAGAYGGMLRKMDRLDEEAERDRNRS